MYILLQIVSDPKTGHDDSINGCEVDMYLSKLEFFICSTNLLSYRFEDQVY